MNASSPTLYQRILKAAYRFTYRVGTRRVLHGIPCSVIGGDSAATQRILSRLDAALELIEAYEPRRLRRLAADTQRVLVVGKERLYGGTTLGSLGWCVFTVPFANDDRQTPEGLATAMVHESTHARIRACKGIRDAQWRTREEVVCIKQERAFAGLLPDGGRFVDWADERLARTAAEWAAVFSKQTDPEQLLRDNGAPRWLTRAIMRLRSRRAA